MELVTPGIGLIIWMTLSFGIVLFILKKLAWRPILDALRKREDSIEEALKSAENARGEMTAVKADSEKLLEEERAEREKMLKQALTTANKIKGDAKEEAVKIGNKMIEDAKNTIENEKKAALIDVKNQVASLSILIAEKLLRKKLGEENEQMKLVDDFVKEINLN
ncbi:MAG: ATP synthase F0 subunit B [Bacteroidetes bacterium]|nr:MAG: ATP synthase F0 subunit B [Bacteroidota bacterium]